MPPFCKGGNPNKAHACAPSFITYGARAMLTGFFLKLKESKVPVTTKEYLMLLEGLKQHVIGPSIDEFYYFSRTCLVKDETNFDKFDRAFGEYFKGVENIMGADA